jgi:hypothetical protein
MQALAAPATYARPAMGSRVPVSHPIPILPQRLEYTLHRIIGDVENLLALIAAVEPSIEISVPHGYGHAADAFIAPNKVLSRETAVIHIHARVNRATTSDKIIVSINHFGSAVALRRRNPSPHLVHCPISIRVIPTGTQTKYAERRKPQKALLHTNLLFVGIRSGLNLQKHLLHRNKKPNCFREFSLIKLVCFLVAISDGTFYQ